MSKPGTLTRWLTVAAVSGLVITSLGCGLEGLLGAPPDPAQIVAPAMGKLKDGDLPGALSQYQAIANENPTVPEAQIGLAYVQMLAGQHDKADATLKGVLDIEGVEDETKNEVYLRRAIVALRAGDVEDVKDYGEKSNTPAGMVLAAEVYLADAESDAAMPLLEKAASSGSGSVKKAAQTYLEYLGDTETGRAQIAEATALWALGQRSEACEAAEDLLRFLPPEFDQRDEMLLLWANRAVTSGQPGIAEGLLDEMSGAPPDQVWRMQATRALISVANGDHDAGIETFTQLGQGGAPADGLADALATAAAISGDAAFAEKVAGGVKSAAVARGLLAAGADGAAKQAAPGSSMLASYLENK